MKIKVCVDESFPVYTIGENTSYVDEEIEVTHGELIAMEAAFAEYKKWQEFLDRECKREQVKRARQAPK